MKISVDKWILTTLKKSDQPNAHNISSSRSSADLVIEQKVSLEQKLYQDVSTDEGDKIEIEIQHEKLNSMSPQVHLTSTATTAPAPAIDDKSFISCIDSNLIETSTSHCSYPTEYSDKPKKKSPTTTFNMLEPNEYRNTKLSDNFYQGEFREETMQSDSEKLITITTTTTTFTSSWQALIEHLNSCLDIFTMRDVISIVEELIKLENYLNNEANLTDREIFFSSQQKIIEELNKSLKTKLFNLSQSTNLFNELKKKLSILLTARLSPNNLKETRTKFDQLEAEYYNRLESIKSKVKLKIAKFENHLTTWNEFDLNCKQLNALFERNNVENSTLLELRSLIIEISNYLNRLKEQLSQLASVCDENKYFELKNHIVYYEIKFKKLKEDANQYSSTNQTVGNSSTSSEINLSSNKSFEMNQQQQHHNFNYHHIHHHISNSNEQEVCRTPPTKRFHSKLFNANHLPEQSVPSCSVSTRKYCNHCVSHTEDSHEEHLNHNTIVSTNKRLRKRSLGEAAKKKTPETSDKSTFTVNEISTQTDLFIPEILKLNYVEETKHSPIDKNNNRNHDNKIAYYSSNNNVNANDGSELKNTNYAKTSNIANESDGKKLLLEAYLRNDQMGNRCSSSSSCSRPTLGLNSSKQKLPAKGNKCETIATTTLTTTTTRESGIGTYNEDEVESLQSANQNVDDYFLSDFNDFNNAKNKQNQIIRITSTNANKENNNSSININNKNKQNEDYLTDNTDDSKNNNNKKYSNKKYRKKLNQRRIISSSSSSVISSSLATSSFTEPSSSLNSNQNKQLSSDSNFSSFNKTSTKLAKHIESDVSSEYAKVSKTQLATAYLFNFIRKLFTLIVFLFPLFFLLLVYFFYVFFLNPSCCDMKRNYLFINIS